ncbi:MAG TPA: WG repeat-containing protein [Bacteroidia bacterium]|nr:WG repeat-containing protein [Bacteroidia bacterium]
MRFLKIISPVFILLLLNSCGGKGKLRAPVKENGKYGYIDESGSYVVKPEFQDAWPFIRGSAVVKEKGKYGLIDKDGKYILEPQFDSVASFTSACSIVEKDSVWGFIQNGTGKEILKPQFEKVFYYTSKLCVVQKGKALGLVNEEGKIVCPVVMQDFKEMFNTGAICIQSDTSDETSMLLNLIQGGGTMKKGLVNFKGEIMVRPKYDDILNSDLTSGFYYPFTRSADVEIDSLHRALNTGLLPAGKYGIIDTSGKIICEPVFDELPVYGDGMFRVKIGDKYGYTDRNGKIVIQPVYNYCDAFSEGLAIVSPKDGKASIIDKTGKVLVEDLGPGAGFYRFYNGLARCRNEDGNYGFLDATGKRVIPPYLDVAEDFSHNRAIVGINNRYGLIDRTGKFVVPNDYDFFYDLEDGYYQTKDVEGNAGVVDSLGNEILKPVYSEVYHLQKNYFTVEKDGLNGCYSLSGKEIFPPKSSSEIYFYNGRCKVISNGKSGIIDSTGKFVVPMVYDSIGAFFKGYATVMMGKKFGAIDSTGKVVIQPQYNELRPFLNGYAVFGENGKYGYIDLSGKKIVDAKFEEAAVLVDPDRKEFE